MTTSTPSPGDRFVSTTDHPLCRGRVAVVVGVAPFANGHGLCVRWRYEDRPAVNTRTAHVDVFLGRFVPLGFSSGANSYRPRCHFGVVGSSGDIARPGGGTRAGL